MKHQVSIPAKFNATIEKVNKFVPVTIERTLPFEVTKHNFTKNAFQIFVKPWTDKPYVFCLACEYKELPKKDYFAMYKSGKPLTAVFSRNASGFDVEIASQ